MPWDSSLGNSQILAIHAALLEDVAVNAENGNARVIDIGRYRGSGGLALAVLVQNQNAG